MKIIVINSIPKFLFILLYATVVLLAFNPLLHNPFL